MKPDTLRFEAGGSNPAPQTLYINLHCSDAIYPAMLVSVTANRRVTMDGPWQSYGCAETLPVCTGYAILRRDTLAVSISLDTSGLDPPSTVRFTVEACDGVISPAPVCDIHATSKPTTVRAWWFQTLPSANAATAQLP